MTVNGMPYTREVSGTRPGQLWVPNSSRPEASQGGSTQGCSLRYASDVGSHRPRCRRASRGSLVTGRVRVQRRTQRTQRPAEADRIADLAVTDASSALAAAGVAPSAKPSGARNSDVEDAGRPGTRPDGPPRGAVPRRRRQARFDATVVEIPICTEPRRHRGRKPDSELVVTPTQPNRGRAGRQQLDRRERRRQPRPAPRGSASGWRRSRSGSGRVAAGRGDVDRQRALRRCRAGIPQPRARALTASCDDHAGCSTRTSPPIRSGWRRWRWHWSLPRRGPRPPASARRPSPATSTPSSASATNPPTGNTPNAYTAA